MNNQKKFGVWMDTQQAVIVGSNGTDEENLVVLAHVKGEEISQNSSEKTSNNQAKMVLAKFFKEITTHLQNATLIHLTGTGTAQEQFIHYLKETQFDTESRLKNEINSVEEIHFTPGTKIAAKLSFSIFFN